MSTVFTWDKKDMEYLLASCETDGILPYIEKYMPKPATLLESGCGLGRYVKYLSDRGWDVTGLEINGDAVEMVKKQWPELKVVEGDAANSPFKANTFDGIISLGVIEHWTDGPSAPIKDIYRTLKPGGVALITTPCVNTVRKFKKLTWWYELENKHSRKQWLSNKGPKPNRLNKGYKFFTHPAYGDFFEYRFTKNEFRDAVEGAGLEVIEHGPSAVIDGFYHDLNPHQKLVSFKNWRFYPTRTGAIANKLLSIFPYFHPHMQIIIARKPVAKPKKKV